MIATELLLPIAQALKLFGNNGTLVVKFHPNALAFFQETEPVFAMMEGLPVPFFVATLQTRGNDRAEILFDAIYSEIQAHALVGKTLYQIARQRKRQTFHDPNLLVGFTASDIQQGALGVVEAFMDWRLNPCLCIRSNQSTETFLIPFQEAFFSNIDFKAKHISLTLPEGLTGINSRD